VSGGELAAALATLVGGDITELRRLSGGASRETWSFDLRRAGGDPEPLVVQLVRAGIPRSSMAIEAELLRAAHAAGVPAPRVVAASDDPAVLGLPFIVLERVEGQTIARRILRDDAYAAVRPRLVGQCAAALARLHAMPPEAVGGLDEPDQLELWAGILHGLDDPHPAFELALRWLAAHRPPPGRTALVHGDFRLGNLVVGPAGLASVLDWELAHRGDPLEDLGWLCVRAWRFGAAAPVAGLGSYAELARSYEAAGGDRVDLAALHWWETLGTLKWGVMCILQARRHLDGTERSVELAAIGRRVCENEWDVLECLDRAPDRARA
jgi:aminoglycoside phosphotransferase (APT) family kinase protein